jgi:hypothetical protein
MKDSSPIFDSSWSARMAAIVFALLLVTASHAILADTTGSPNELAGLCCADDLVVVAL